MPLTDFVSPGGDDGRGVVVREPHNSYISSLTRGGLVYFCLWGYVILAPLWAAAKGARLKALSAEAGGQYKGVAAWSVVTMFMILAQAFSEPNFEIPSIAAMYYFVAGMAMMEYVTITGRVRYPMAEPRP
jgi:O-antigen ligase